MTPIHAATQTHGLIFVLLGDVFIGFWPEKQEGPLETQRIERKKAADFSTGNTAGLSESTTCHGALTPTAVCNLPSKVTVTVPFAFRAMVSIGGPSLTTLIVLTTGAAAFPLLSFTLKVSV
jgi:hypothetical protein